MSERTAAARLAPPLEQWYAENGRQFPWRTWDDAYRITVAELLLQRTQAHVVAAFLPDFLVEYPNWDALAAADASVLAARLAPLGLHRRRSEVLRIVARSYLDGPEEPYERHPGIGQYIGRAIRVSLRSSREAMVDANFVRLLRRHFGGEWMADYRYDPRLQGLAAEMVTHAQDPRKVNWAVLDFAATVCRPHRPRCGECPLLSNCVFASGGVG